MKLVFASTLIVLALAGGAAAAKAKAPGNKKPKAADPTSTCNRSTVPRFCGSSEGHGKSNPKNVCSSWTNTGLGTGQGPYLEGLGLEGRHFTLTQGKNAFPPEANAVFTDAAGCDDPPLALTIVGCESGTTAFNCQVTASIEDVCGVKGKGSFLGVTLVQGYWSLLGAFTPDKATYTFSCNAEASPGETQPPMADGAVSRCLRDYRFEPTPSDPSDDALTACIRMQRGDYCGDGQPHTITGTNIDVHTKENRLRKDECADGRCFEATWSSGGAICVGHSRWLGDDGLDFMKTQCFKDGKFPTDGKTGFYCSGKFSLDDLTSRSRVNTCHQTWPAECVDDKYPTCKAGAAKKEPEKMK
jgi:hypothetical protein